MGRLCGIQHFLSELAFVEEKADATNLRRARKELAEIREEMPDLIDIDIDDDEEQGKSSDNPLKLCQIEISRRH